MVAYANDVKSGLLGVPPEVIEEHGAVSEPVVLAMAQGGAQGHGRECGRGYFRHCRAGWGYAGQAGGHGLDGLGVALGDARKAV